MYFIYSKRFVNLMAVFLIFYKIKTFNFCLSNVVFVWILYGIKRCTKKITHNLRSTPTISDFFCHILKYPPSFIHNIFCSLILIGSSNFCFSNYSFLFSLNTTGKKQSNNKVFSQFSSHSFSSTCSLRYGNSNFWVKTLQLSKQKNIKNVKVLYTQFKKEIKKIIFFEKKMSQLVFTSSLTLNEHSL